jgi:hypothetical protein
MPRALFDVAEESHLGFLLDTLLEKGDIRRSPGYGVQPEAWILTASGWDRLSPSDPGGVLGTVFVAMAFEPDMDAAFDAAIQPAVNDCALTVTHVGRVHHNDLINDVILSGIRAAQVVVADVTHQRNGVYFEGALEWAWAG